MSRRLLLFALVAVTAFAAAAAALGADGQPQITEAVSTGFPSRSFVLTLPHGMQLKPDAVHISENGKAVNAPLVVPVGEAKQRQFGAILVIDASTSMEGKPEKAAFSAAPTKSFSLLKPANSNCSLRFVSATPEKSSTSAPPTTIRTSLTPNR